MNQDDDEELASLDAKDLTRKCKLAGVSCAGACAASACSFHPLAGPASPSLACASLPPGSSKQMLQRLRWATAFLEEKAAREAREAAAAATAAAAAELAVFNPGTAAAYWRRAWFGGTRSPCCDSLWLPSTALYTSEAAEASGVAGSSVPMAQPTSGAGSGGWAVVDSDEDDAGAGGGASNGVGGAAIDGEPLDGEVIDGEPLDGEAIDGEALDGEPLDGEPLDGEPLDGEPLDGEPLDGEPLDGEPIDGEPLDGEPMDVDMA